MSTPAVTDSRPEEVVHPTEGEDSVGSGTGCRGERDPRVDMVTSSSRTRRTGTSRGRATTVSTTGISPGRPATLSPPRTGTSTSSPGGRPDVSVRPFPFLLSGDEPENREGGIFRTLRGLYSSILPLGLDPLFPCPSLSSFPRRPCDGG